MGDVSSPNWPQNADSSLYYGPKRREPCGKCKGLATALALGTALGILGLVGGGMGGVGAGGLELGALGLLALKIASLSAGEPSGDVQNGESLGLDTLSMEEFKSEAARLKREAKLKGLNLHIRMTPDPSLAPGEGSFNYGDERPGDGPSINFADIPPCRYVWEHEAFHWEDYQDSGWKKFRAKTPIEREWFPNERMLEKYGPFSPQGQEALKYMAKYIRKARGG